MDTERLKECLAADYLLLRDLANGDLTAPVPSCPEWTLADLLSHVAHVYLHKVETMRHNSSPDPWPPPPTGETEAELLDRGYRELRAEFAARPVTEQVLTWYGPDQTVGFWLRRMTQETVIHRIDAELAAGVASRPVPDDLAADGIDEVLRIFLAWASKEWLEDFAEPLAKGDGSVLVSAGGQSWLVAWDSSGVSTEPGKGAADAEIAGAPDAVLRWLWRRAGDQVIEISGNGGQGPHPSPRRASADLAGELQGRGQGPHPSPRRASADLAGELQGRDKVAQLRALLESATQ
jgi:uncharacterized protein (TIGR03083 family)